MRMHTVENHLKAFLRIGLKGALSPLILHTFDRFQKVGSALKDFPCGVFLVALRFVLESDFTTVDAKMQAFRR